MFERPAEVPPSASPTSGTGLNPVRSHQVELPKGKHLNRKLIGGVPLIGLTCAAPAVPETTDQESDKESDRNLELLLLGIGPFEDRGQSASPVRQAPPSTEPLKRKECAHIPHTASDEESSHKRQRKSGIKSLRFECQSNEPPKPKKANRRDTPYKHSRREAEFEE
jgi:hypothetical protein